MNPFAQRESELGIDPRLDWRIQLPGQRAEEASPAEHQEADAKELSEVLAIAKPSDRRKALRKFLAERQFIEPVPLDTESTTRKRTKVCVVGWNRSGRMTTGGVVNSLGVMVITGDGCNSVGVGYGQAGDAPKALDRAYRRALRSMIRVPKFMLHTIREPVEKKVGASIVKMWPALDQRGYRCNQYVKHMAELCGVSDIRSRVLRRRHTFNQTKAAFECLKELSRRFEGEVEALLEAGDVDRAHALLSQAFHPEPAADPAAAAMSDLEAGRQVAEAASRFRFAWVSPAEQEEIVRGKQREAGGVKGAPKVDWDSLQARVQTARKMKLMASGARRAGGAGGAGAGGRAEGRGPRGGRGSATAR